MKRQVANELNGQAQYPAPRLGFLRRTTAGIIGIVCLSVMACQPLPVPADGSGSETTLAAAAPATEGEATEGEATEGEEAAMIELSAPEQMLFDLAAADLATELGVTPDQVQVASVQTADFADASLDCPEEGMMYAQVITSGYVLMLDVDGAAYEYHGSANGNGHVVHCKK